MFPNNLKGFKNSLMFWGRLKVYWKRAFRSKIGVFISFILFSSNLCTGSILISLKLDNRSSLFKGLDIYTVLGVEANESIDFVVKEGEEVTIQDQVFIPLGDIVVERGGKLILQYAEVIFNNTHCFEHGIILKENTTLWIKQSKIRGVNNLFFFKAQNTTLIIEDSKLRMTHVLCGNFSRISIVRSDLWALHCFNESTVDIINARLHYLFLRGRSSAQVDDSHIVEVLLYDNSKASLLDTVLKNVFYFDEGAATLSNCSYVDTIRFKPKLCDLTITVLDEVNQDPIPAVNVTLNRPKGYKVASSLTDDDGSASFSGLEEGDYFAEAEMEGYVPLSARIPLLNETQHETLMIHRMEGAEEKPQMPTNGVVTILTVMVLATLVLSLYYKFKMRR